PGLTRTAMAAAVMGDAPVAMRDQEKHLVFEGVRAQRPPMAEDDGLPRAPVFVVNLGAVLGGDRAHTVLSLVVMLGCGALQGKNRACCLIKPRVPARCVPSSSARSACNAGTWEGPTMHLRCLFSGLRPCASSSELCSKSGVVLLQCPPPSLDRRQRF